MIMTRQRAKTHEKSVLGKGTLAAAAKAAERATAALAKRKRMTEETDTAPAPKQKSGKKVRFNVFLLPLLFFTFLICE